MYSYIIVVRYTMNFDLTEEAKKQLDYMIARHRYLHRHPCVSFHEEDARDYLATEIAALGPDTLRPCGKNGLVADLHGHTGGKTIAWTPYRSRRKRACPLPRKTPASCTPAATTATRQPCWACCDL